jgi:hypothetical protein
MPLNDITFLVKGGGLARQAPGEDHVSALLFAIAAPAAYSGAKMKSYTGLTDIEADGIIETNATYAVAWYQAREFYRIAPGATLWMAFNATYPELLTGTSGKLRQIGTTVATLTDVTSVLQAAATTWATSHAPVQFVAGFEPVATANLTTIASADTLNAPNVSVVLFGSHVGKGAALATSTSKAYISAIGAVLGAIAAASVHESIAWVQKFNLSDGVELETVRVADGTVPTDSVLNGLNDKRYIVGRKHIGIAGTYLNDSHAATVATSDYAMLESTRTVNKARRLLRTAMLPRLNSPVLIDATSGKLDSGTVAELEALGLTGLQAMLQAGEVSGIDVYVNPDQNVLSTGQLQIEVRIVPVGVARNIRITIGLTLKL